MTIPRGRPSRHFKGSRDEPARVSAVERRRGQGRNKTAPLYVVCSPFRGVGKTLVSRRLAEFSDVNDRAAAAFDLADEGPQLAAYLPDITTVANVGDTSGQMAFFDRLIADDVGARIIDLSHRMFKNFFTVVQEIQFFEEARRRSIEPLILFIIDPDPSPPQPTLRFGASSRRHLSYRCVIRSKQPRRPIVLRAQMRT
jgi:hypothetical protein